MVNIPDNYQVGGEAVYSESDRLKLLRARERRQGFLTSAGGRAAASAAGHVADVMTAGLFSGMMHGLMGAARRRTDEAIERRQREEQAAANERRRIEHYEATYGKFDLTSASAAGARQAPATDLLSALQSRQGNAMNPHSRRSAQRQFNETKQNLKDRMP